MRIVRRSNRATTLFKLRRIRNKTTPVETSTKFDDVQFKEKK